MHHYKQVHATIVVLAAATFLRFRHVLASELLKVLDVAFLKKDRLQILKFLKQVSVLTSTFYFLQKLFARGTRRRSHRTAELDDSECFPGRGWR